MKQIVLGIFLLATITAGAQVTTIKPWIWSSELPKDCPFSKSKQLVGIAFTGKHSDYKFADTWYPSWASDDKLYSPWTDGGCPKSDGGWESSASDQKQNATTGQAVMEGNDPIHLKVYSLGLCKASAEPYAGRYPCGSLVYNGVWYYGTYCLGPGDPTGDTKYGNEIYNWPWLGPFVGFRISKDFGRTWTECPHSPAKPIFGENGKWGYPVKIGSPHFVDFGKNMEHSPDGKAYLIAHGASPDDPKPRFGNASWITGDQIYLLRVTPSPEAINDSTQYEFFGGYKKGGTAIWVNSLSKAKTMLEWNNNMGCVTVTYNAPLKKYLMCVTDGGNTNSFMNTYILESDKITGPWKIVTYMKHFGEQGYFVNIPAKFISSDGKTAWLCYSAGFNGNAFGSGKLRINPPTNDYYGLVLQEIKLLDKKMDKKYKDNPKPEIK
jgi:hypothetical protein